MPSSERKASFPEKTYSRREFLRLFLWNLPMIGIGLAFDADRRTKVKPLQRAFPELDNQSLSTIFIPLVMNNNESREISGLCYSPYRDGQNPDWGPYPNLDEIRQDIDILNSTVLCPYFNKGVVKDIRTYGSDHNLEKIPQLILEKNSPLKVNAGCWLGRDSSINEKLIANLIEEANRFPNVTAVTVGNETQQFQIIPEQKLISYIAKVKQQIPGNIAVTTGDTWYAWTRHPQLAEKSDFILAHFFPYWEPNPVPVENAVDFIKEKYQLLQNLYPGKKVVIGEAGWPSAGEARGEAVPSLQNHNRFLTEFVFWATQEKIDFYLFSAFDEKWKKRYEGEVGGHWGIYNSDRTRKSFCQPF